MESRPAALKSLFGDTFEVFTESEPGEPQINALVFAPTDDRPFFTIVTDGLSDIGMDAPTPLMFRRVELVIYADEPDEGLAQVLLWLASLVGDHGHWLNPGSTMPNGDPPEALFEDTELDSFSFIQCLYDSDFTLPDLLSIGSDPVSLLWVVPITTDERQFLTDNSVDAFYPLLEENEHGLAFNAPRDSYV